MEFLLERPSEFRSPKGCTVAAWTPTPAQRRGGAPGRSALAESVLPPMLPALPAGRLVPVGATRALASALQRARRPAPALEAPLPCSPQRSIVPLSLADPRPPDAAQPGRSKAPAKPASRRSPHSPHRIRTPMAIHPRPRRLAHGRPRPRRPWASMDAHHRPGCSVVGGVRMGVGTWTRGRRRPVLDSGARGCVGRAPTHEVASRASLEGHDLGSG